MFKTGVVKLMSVAHGARSGSIIGIFFSIFFNMKVCCLFSFESPRRGNSNEYMQYINFKIITENHPKLYQICSYEIFPKRLKNEVKTAVVNKPSKFEPLKF